MKKIIAMLLFCSAVLPGEQVVIPIEKYTLPNGMRVILSQDNAVPVVAVYMIYNVGARSEEKGRTGFAHLFEHMMFEGSANAPKGMQDQDHRVQRRADERLHASRLHRLLRDAAVEQAGQRAVPRIRPHAQPGHHRREPAEPEGSREAGTAAELRQPAVLHGHRGPLAAAGVSQLAELALADRLVRGSQRGVGGRRAPLLQDLLRAEQRRAGHRGRHPDPRSEEADRGLISATFPSQPQPKRPDLAEPAGAKPQSDVYKDPLANVPGVIIGYPARCAGSPDYNALYMLDASPHRRRQLALSARPGQGQAIRDAIRSQSRLAFASAIDYKDPGVYGMFMLYKPNFTGKQIVDQVQDEIARIQKEGVPADELRARPHVSSLGAVSCRCRARSAARACWASTKCSTATRPDQFRAGEISGGDVRPDPGGGEEIPDAARQTQRAAKSCRRPSRPPAPRRANMNAHVRLALLIADFHCAGDAVRAAIRPHQAAGHASHSRLQAAARP